MPQVDGDEAEVKPPTTWVPENKVTVPTMALLATWILTSILKQWKGIEVSVEIYGGITSVMAFIIGYAIPTSYKEIRRRLDNLTIKQLDADPRSNVDLAKVIDDTTIIKAQLDPASPASIPAGETINSLEQKLVVAEVKAAVAEAKAGVEVVP